jgi:O-antigen/teichoic acid export membrane protein
MAWVVAGQAVAAAGAIVGVAALTRVLPPDRYGELALGLTLGTLGQLLAWSPIAGATLRYFSPAQESLQLNAYLGAARRLLLHATAALIGLACLVVLMLVGLGSTRWMGLSLAALLFTLVSGYAAVLDNMQIAGRQRRVAAWHQGASMWLRFLLALVLVHLFGPSSTVAMLGFAVGIVLALVSQMLFFHRVILTQSRRHPTAAAEDVAAMSRKMTLYAWPIAAWGVFSWVQTVSDRWVLQAFTTTSTVGVYTVLNQVGLYPMTLLSTITLQFISPLLFERAGDGSDRDRLRHASALIVTLVAITVIVTAVATVAAWSLHRPLFDALVGARYRSASHLLPWMVCAGGLFASGQAASQAIMVAGHTKRLILPKGVIALVTFGLYALGAGFGGLEGIVYANTGFGAMYFAWMGYLAKEWRASVVRQWPLSTGTA